MNDTVPLRVMVFNILRGGDRLNPATGDFFPDGKRSAKSLEAVIAAIALAKPDIVGLEEAEGNSGAIADRLGWHCSSRTQIISRYPLIDPPGADGAYVLAELSPGKIVAVANAHPPSDPYGPYLVRDGAGLAEVLANEAATRMPAIQRQLAVLPALAAAGIPVFLTGDFNTPSHLDWTEAVSKHRPHVRYAVPWPMSRATEAVGLRDSFREAHPDPIEVPGFTWSPGGPECDPDEVHDRIDWVLAAGPAVTVASDILGEVGGVDVSHAVDRFPSDHRAVVSTFRVTPADTPALVAVDARRVFAGDQLTVSYRSAPDGAEIAIMAADGSISAPISPQPIKANPWPHGAAAFDTGGLAPGRYDAVLLDGAGEVLSRSPFWLYPRGMSAELTVSKTVFKAGETVAVTWRAAPGNRWDWLAIIPATAQVPESSPGELTSDRSVLRHIHTDAQIEGSARFDGDPRQGLSGWPLPPGQYEIRLLLDDGYRLLASSPPFRVEP